MIMFYRFLRGSCWGEQENDSFISLFHFSSPRSLVLSNYILKPTPYSCFRECSCSQADVRLDAMLPASTPSAKATRRHCSSLGVGSRGNRVAATGRKKWQLGQRGVAAAAAAVAAAAPAGDGTGRDV